MLAALLLLTLATVPARGATPLPIEALFESPGLFGTPPSTLKWSPDGTTLAFRWARPGAGARSLWLVDADGANLRRAEEGVAAGVSEFVWLEDGSGFLLLSESKLWSLKLDGGTRSLVSEVAPGAHDLGLAPDGRSASFLLAGDLVLIDLESSTTRTLSRVGIAPLSVPPTARYSRPEREIGPGIWGGPTYAWSPDGGLIAVHHVDRRRMRSVPFPNYLADETNPNPVRRGYPGDSNEARRVGLLDPSDGRLRLLELDDPQSHQIVGFAWSASNDLLIDVASDTNTLRRLYVLRSGESTPELIWESRRDSRIYTRFAARWAANGRDIVVLSDHQDYYGLYRLPAQAGAQLQRLDDPDYDVLGPPKITGNGTLIYETTAGRPAEQHIMRRRPGAEVGAPEYLTTQPGHHTAYPAPSGGAVAMLRSDDRSPPELYMLAAGERELRRVTQSTTDAFGDFALAQVRYLSVPATDERPALAIRLSVPADFDETRRYPVLFGPMYSNTVRNRWGAAYTLMQQALTQRGYLVVQVDVRGSTGYGRDFREAFLNDFAGGDIEDIEDAVEHLKGLPYVDGDRLGIWGSSYGGTLTVYTLLKKPGLFAAGVGAASAVDPYFFGTDDVAIVRRPGDGSGIFERRAEDLVANLEDALLLVHGMQDQVVPFKTVASLADAFIRAGKPIETAFLPGATHGWRREPPYDRHVFSRMVEFFDRHLKAPARADARAKPSDETPLDPDIVAAIDSFVRGTPFKDDLDPATARTGRALPPLQANYDVQRYHLNLRVMPSDHAIDGSVTVDFLALENLRSIELDLDPDLTVDRVSSGDDDLAVVRNGDRFRIDLANPMAAGERATVVVEYSGKPHVALVPPWHGGFVWSEVDGKPWFATAVQTEGCDLWWPCKDSYADKPDSGIAVSITAPDSISVASIGRLARVEDAQEGWKTWHWESRHPYTGYAVAINGGPFERVRRQYRGINGTRFAVEFWALEKNADKAEALVESDVVPDLEFFERLLGPYPWGDEKAGFVETPHLGMEHQTINGYGEQYARGRYGYDWLLHHELAHEWFGNIMTHEGPEDAWLHEGYAAYMQAVYAEETMGSLGYFDHLYGAYTSNANCAAVVDPAVADVGEAFDNRDIYTKGAWLLHTVRRHIGETAFWRGTRRLLYDTAEPWDLSYPIQARYRSTDDFIRIMSDEAGEELRWLVEGILYDGAMPVLAVERGDGEALLTWELSSDRPFPMPVTVAINEERRRLTMGPQPTRIIVPDDARFVVDPDSALFRSLPIIGDCAEQTENRVDSRIERYSKMARDYGWQRP
ncbi:MAG: prolyl oligopeptidase family serine peptidase [Pseudomonadota bacterium]